MAGIIPDEGVLHNYCREGKIDKITVSFILNKQFARSFTYNYEYVGYMYVTIDMHRTSTLNLRIFFSEY